MIKEAIVVISLIVLYFIWLFSPMIMGVRFSNDDNDIIEKLALEHVLFFVLLLHIYKYLTR